MAAKKNEVIEEVKEVEVIDENVDETDCETEKRSLKDKAKDAKDAVCGNKVVKRITNGAKIVAAFGIGCIVGGKIAGKKSGSEYQDSNSYEPASNDTNDVSED